MIQAESLVSVIIPAYNRSSILVSAVQSVLCQSYKPLEIIVIDDGSTDDTENVVREKFGSQVTYHYKPNGGASSARNAGIRLAKGEYVAFLDSDDWWADTKIQKQVEFMENHPEHGMVLCDLEVRDQYNETRFTSSIGDRFPRDGWAFEWFLNTFSITCSILFVRKEVLDEVGFFDESLETAEDLDLVLRICSEFKVGIVSEVLAFYRMSPDALSGTVATGNSIKALYKMKEYAPGLFESHWPTISEMIFAQHLKYAKESLWGRSYSSARKHLRKCLQIRQSSVAYFLYFKSLMYQVIGR